MANLLAAEQAERNRKVLFVIDEAHLLSPEQLKELRLLSLCRTRRWIVPRRSRDCSSASRHLPRGCTRGSSLPSISASASATRSGGMDLAESVGYLRHHLELAVRTDQLIADDAAARLHRYANGIPRALNNAAMAGLMAAAADGKGLVDDVCAKKAVVELTRT